VTVLYMADILLSYFLPVDVRPDRVIRAMVGFILFEAVGDAARPRSLRKLVEVLEVVSGCVLDREDVSLPVVD